MDNQAAEKKPQTQELLLKADEIDAGTTIRSPSGTRPLSALTPADVNAPITRPTAPPRPILRREGSTPPPPPPSQPPPAPPTQPEDPTDSLSLPQLRQLVRHFPRPEPKAFAYQYQDAQDFPIEIDEWFHYTKPDQDRDYLLAAREAFEETWQLFCESKPRRQVSSWINVPQNQRSAFLRLLRSRFSDTDNNERQRAIAALLYVLSGVWRNTAGLGADSEDVSRDDKPQGNTLQIEWIHRNVDLAVELELLTPLHECMRTALERPLANSRNKATVDDVYEGVFDDAQYCELSFCFSCFYMVVESARSRLLEDPGQKVRKALLSLQPNFLVFMTKTISQLRWDESYNIPLMHAVQLLWKSILLAFGDTKTYLERVKGILQPRVDPFSTEACKPVLTASPLDYHLFRQEITSKYPAYNPPPPLIPLEAEQRSILPPLPQHAARTDAFATFHRTNHSSGSIMHQPVHIATPAPSPPPSPGGPGGKGGKKQNYQTNQNFPFLYPPLDSDSNFIGGKGSTEHQDSYVARRWEGSDVPASILEAGKLFAERMRMTRAMRQLWKEREAFLKYDRGWNSDKQAGKQQTPGASAEEDKLQDADLQDRLDTVEHYFHHALPDLQSLIIVMMKVMLTNVQDIAVRNSQYQEAQNQQGGLNRTKSSSNLNNAPNTIPNPPSPPRPNEVSLEDLDNIRSREISQKAISACLFLMLKWFKISHILKFEYITQLMLDSNYIQLTLKYFAHQNLEELVSFRYDRDELSFWRYCQIHSDHPPLSPTSPDHRSDHEASDDEAAPPPIQRHRRSPTTASENQQATQQPQTPNQEPSLGTTFMSPQPLVDELGNPLTEFPSHPLSSTTFSTRHFHTSISLLRILQKVTRAKAHRVLLLVSFKSAQILRRILRVPEPMLRLYVLKLFKSQVPYCGRKWRQSNMRVITAIYLHCRPELRDEWLAGLHDAAPGAGMGGAPGNVDGAEYEEAVPQEWSLRGMTYWWIKREYADMMGAKAKRNRMATEGDGVDKEVEGAGQEIDEEERDFFKRELDAIGWGLAEMQVRNEGEEVGFGEEAPGARGEVPNGVSANGSQQGQGQNIVTSAGQDFGPNSAHWAAQSPNSEIGPMGIAQGGANVMGNANLAAWQ